MVVFLSKCYILRGKVLKVVYTDFGVALSQICNPFQLCMVLKMPF